jgi:hypothetical protein
MSQANRIAEMLGRLNDSALIRGRTLKAIIRVIQRGLVIPGDNLEYREMPDGVLINAKPGGSTSVTPCVFDVVLKPSFILQMATGGLVGGIVPSNLFNSYVVPDPAYGALSNFGLTDGWNWLTASVTSSNGRITEVELAILTSAPAPIGATEGAPPTSFLIPLAAIFANDDGPSFVYRLRGCGNVVCRPRRIYSRTDPAAGCSYPLIHTWTWEVA